jgi:peptidoglycan-N-acetylglucosamine deacetylase
VNTLKLVVVSMLTLGFMFFVPASDAVENVSSQNFVNQKEKFIALTFDDGPHHIYTNKILDTLEAYHAQATFFVVGRNVSGNKEIMLRMVKDGDEIGNHTWSHPLFTHLSKEKIVQEMAKSQQAIEDVVHYRAAIFRPPYGSYNHFVLVTVGLPFILWTVDPEDWKKKSVQNVVHMIIKETKTVPLFYCTIRMQIQAR